MFKTITLCLMTCVSVHLFALKCAPPVTLSDARFDAEGPEISVNKKGDVGAFWISRQGPDKAVTVAYKSQNGAWASPEAISGLEGDIRWFSSFIDASGNLFATWEIKKEGGCFVQFSRKEAGREWMKPFDWITPKQEFRFSDHTFNPLGYLIFVGTHPITLTYSPAYQGGQVREVKKDVMAVLTKPLFQEEGRMFFDGAIDESIYDFKVASNNNGISYVIYYARNYKTEERFLIGQKLENGKILDRCEKICALRNVISEPSLSLNEKGDVAIAFDTENDVYAITKLKGVWSKPTLLAKAEEKPWSAKVAIDEAGNVMVACTTICGKYKVVKTIYKSYEGAWAAPIQFPCLDKDNWSPDVKSDQIGNFVVIWQQEERNRQAIFGATFSTTTQAWTTAELLSPNGISCHSCSFEFWAPGKGFISWTASPNGFDKTVQVAELSTEL